VGDAPANGSSSSSIAAIDFTASPDAIADELLRVWARDINRVSDENVATRRRALQALHSGVTAVAAQLAAPALQQEAVALSGNPPPATALPLLPALTAAGEEVLQRLLDALAKPLFKRFSDPGETCRELSLRLTSLLIQGAPDLARHLAYLLPALAARGVSASANYKAVLRANQRVHGC
jgi:hypothetical protein